MVTTMAEQDPVRKFLIAKGCPEHVVRRGLGGLVEDWEKVVQSVEHGYSLGLEDYLNDLDGSQLLEEMLEIASPGEKKKYLPRIHRADRVMKSLSASVERCLWGEETARKEGWTPEKNWWYFSRPIKGNPEFLSELDRTAES